MIKPNFEDPSSLFINVSIDPFNSAASSEFTNGGFGNAIDVVPQYEPVTAAGSQKMA